MAIRLTGTDTNGVIANADGDWWITLAGELVANTGGAFDFNTHTDVTYSIEGTVISSTSRAIDSSHGATDFADNQVLIAETGVVRSERGAILLYGTGNVVQNEGSVTSTGGSFDDAIRISGANGSITNIGTIQSTGSAMQIDGDDGSIANHGLAIGQDNAVFLYGDDGRVENHGTLRGATQAIVVRGDGNTVLNAGTLVGDRHAIEIHYNNATGDVTTITNTGTMQNVSGTEEAIKGSSGDELIENEGHISGRIELFDGDDRYVSMAGTLTGLLDMGHGDDVTVLGDAVLSERFDYDGGAGSDTLDLSDFAHGIWIDLTYAGVEVWTRDNTDWQDATGAWREIVDVSGVENFVGTNGIDMMRGNDEDNTFGYKGSQFITGTEIIGGRGGTDTVDFSRAGFAVWVDLDYAGAEAWTQDDADATDSAGAFREIADLADIENLIGSDRVDALYGTAGDNVFGYRGSAAFAGTEIINGRGGADTVDFSGFEDAVWVDLTYAGPEAWTQDDFNATDVFGAFREIADLAGIENITGTDRWDLIAADSGANVIEGGGGDDDIYGRGGADTFVYRDNFGRDTLFDFSADNAEKIDLSDVTEITDFADLVANHIVDIGGTAAIEVDASNRIYLDGWTVTDIGATDPIDADDFIF